MLALALAFSAVLAGCGKKDSGGGGAASAAGSTDSAPAAGGSGPAKAVSGGKEAKETDFIYELNEAGNGVVITGYQKDAAGGDLVIPATIEGYPVVAVVYGFGAGFGEGFEYYDSDLKRPRTAAEIKAKGLRPAITSIVFPDSITEIRQAPGVRYSFFNMNYHLKSIVFPKDLKEIPSSFSGVGSLTTVTWPETLEIIGYEAFNSTGLTELVLPEGVREIRDAAFIGCENLTTVTIPASIEKIGDRAFSECPVLATVNIPAKTIQYQRYEDGAWRKSWNGAFRRCPKLTGIAARKAITDTGYEGEF
jgi:hypothetical protein